MKIAIIGSGAWGTALAQVLVDNQHDVTIYGRNEDELKAINELHQNPAYFGDLQLASDLHATSDLAMAIRGVGLIVMAVPVVALRSVCTELVPLLTSRPIIVNVAKGFDPVTGGRLSDAIRSIIPVDQRTEVCTLIGPSYAEEVAERLYTTIACVSVDATIASTVQAIFSNNYFRCYTLSDEIGAEYGAAMKNIIAVASGIIAGMGFRDNTRAGLITRGLAEMMKWGTVMGGKKDTYLGLTGLGDLTLTASSSTSRNFQAGYAIGKAGYASDFLAHNTKTVEGILATKIIHEQSQKAGIELPIVNAVYAVLYEGKDAKIAIQSLVNRKLKAEFEG